MSKRDFEAREALDAVLRHIDEAVEALCRLPPSDARTRVFVYLGAASGHAREIDLTAEPARELVA